MAVAGASRNRKEMRVLVALRMKAWSWKARNIGRKVSVNLGKTRTMKRPERPIIISTMAYRRTGDLILWPKRMERPFPRARPPIKADNTIELAQTLLPRLNPSNWNHRDSKTRADAPDRKKIMHKSIIIS